MFTNPHNQNLLNDVMRVLSGETTETPIKPVPQWITEAAGVAVSDIRSVLSEGGVVTSETRRDMLRKHLSNAIQECNCSVNGETALQFEEEVRKMERKGGQIAEKVSDTYDLLDAIENAYKKGGLKGVIQGGKQLGFIDRTTVDDVLQDLKRIIPNLIDRRYAAREIEALLKPQDFAKYKNLKEEVEIEEARIGVGRSNEPLSRTLTRAAKAMKITGKAPPKPTKPPEKKEEVEDGEVDSVQEETERINEIVDGLREFVSKLTEEEVSVLRTIINENN